MDIAFGDVLQYLLDASESGTPLHPGFGPTPRERQQRDQIAIQAVLAKQIEENRQEIDSLKREIAQLRAFQTNPRLPLLREVTSQEDPKPFSAT